MEFGNNERLSAVRWRSFLDRRVQLAHRRKYMDRKARRGIVVFRVGDDADNFVVGGVFLIEGSEVAADGIFVGKEFLDERLIDYGDHARSGGVLIGEAAAANDRVGRRFQRNAGSHDPTTIRCALPGPGAGRPST